MPALLDTLHVTLVAHLSYIGQYSLLQMAILDPEASGPQWKTGSDGFLAVSKTMLFI